MASLILHPVNTHWRPEKIDDLYVLLRSIGLAGGHLPETVAPGFLVGEHFLSLVSFMGCAPAIHLAPDEGLPDQAFCSIRVHLEAGRPRFLIAKGYTRPRCPLCRSVVEPDSTDLSADTITVCDRCATETPLHALNWRKTAGFACCFIEITGVYPQEALPTDVLLSQLQAFSNCSWRYFYY